MNDALFIRHSASILPAEIVSNTDLVERMAQRSQTPLTEEQREYYAMRAATFEAKTGIRERRFFGPDEDVISIASALAEQTAGGSDWGTIDAILVASSSAQGFPGIAQHIVPVLRERHPRLGNPFVLDITSNACTSYLYALGVAASLMRSQGYRNALCLSVEVASRSISYDLLRWGTSSLFGDGASGALISREGGFALLRSIEMSSRLTPETLPLIRGSGQMVRSTSALPEEQRWHVEGPKVAGWAVKLLADVLTAQSGHGKRVEWLIPHQANRRGVLTPACARAEFPAERMLTTLEFLGNTSSASIPLTLDHFHRQGRFQEGERVLLASFGASFTVASATLEMLPPEK